MVGADRPGRWCSFVRGRACFRLEARAGSEPAYEDLQYWPVPSESLAELEQKLAGLLVQFKMLSEAWPKAPRAVDRARIGREPSLALDKIGSLQPRIALIALNEPAAEMRV